MTQFVDTNIFLRYLTRDDPEKAEACFQLMEKAKNGEASLTTSESVIAEVVFVLASPRVYALPRSEVRARLYPILALEGLRIPDRRKYFRALDLYANHAIDFEDALTVADMEHRQIEELYSYDQDFDKLGNVKRLES
jgi:predicted nucleic acid-binding protein